MHLKSNNFAFDKVWQLIHLYELKLSLPYNYYLFLRFYLIESSFRIRIEHETSQLCPLKARVPQGSALGPVLYSLFTVDLPTCSSTKTATFADDTSTPYRWMTSKSYSIIFLIVQIVVFSAKGTISKETNKMFAKETQFFIFYKVLELLNSTL